MNFQEVNLADYKVLIKTSGVFAFHASPAPTKNPGQENTRWVKDG